MADKYLDPLLFFDFPQLDFSLVTRFLLLASQSLPHPMFKKSKNKPRPPKNPYHNRRTLTPPPPPPVEASAPAAEASASAPAPPAPAPAPPEAPANSAAPQPSLSSATESVPKLGNRKGKGSDEGEKAVNNTIPHSGLQVPGAPLQSDDEKSSLKIKIHLNLHAKVHLDLDAQVYGDVVIGLL